MDSEVIKYLIVIGSVIIWIVSKLLKSTKTDTSTTPPLNPSSGKKLKDWWEELEQEVKKPTMTPVPQPIPKQQNVAARTTKHAIDSVNPNYFEEKHSNYKNAEFALAHQPVQHLEVMDNDNTRSTHKPLNINLKSNDEVRRAFVYSEIFNRKY